MDCGCKEILDGEVNKNKIVYTSQPNKIERKNMKHIDVRNLKISTIASVQDCALPPEGCTKTKNYRIFSPTHVPLQRYSPTGDINTTPKKNKIVSKYNYVENCFALPHKQLVKFIEQGRPRDKLLETILRPLTCHQNKSWINASLTESCSSDCWRYASDNYNVDNSDSEINNCETHTDCDNVNLCNTNVDNLDSYSIESINIISNKCCAEKKMSCSCKTCSDTIIPIKITCDDSNEQEETNLERYFESKIHISTDLDSGFYTMDAVDLNDDICQINHIGIKNSAANVDSYLESNFESAGHADNLDNDSCIDNINNCDNQCTLSKQMSDLKTTNRYKMHTFSSNCCDMCNFKNRFRITDKQNQPDIIFSAYDFIQTIANDTDNKYIQTEIAQNDSLEFNSSPLKCRLKIRNLFSTSRSASPFTSAQISYLEQDYRNPDFDEIEKRYLDQLALSIENDSFVNPQKNDLLQSASDLRCRAFDVSTEIAKIKREIREIDRDFQLNTLKVEKLLEGVRTYRKELDEVRYLDGLIYLLEGKEYQAKNLFDWPFQLFTNSSQTNQKNLIV